MDIQNRAPTNVPLNAIIPQSPPKMASVYWKLYYQAMFKLFLSKNKITLSSNQTEVITIEVDQPYVEIK